MGTNGNGIRLFHDIGFLRIAAVVLSLCFIPAFLFGAASVWAITLGIALALLFDGHLAKIIEIAQMVRIFL